MLPKDLQLLKIKRCEDLRSLCDVPPLKHTTKSKEIRIEDYKGIKHVVSSSSVIDSLQTLEILQLLGLGNLRRLFRKERATTTQVPPNTFSCLKVINIDLCPKIKKLLPAGLLLHLHNLEEIYVRRCN